MPSLGIHVVLCWALLPRYLDAFSTGTRESPSLRRRKRTGESSCSLKFQPTATIAKDDFNSERDYYDFLGGDSCGRPILIEGALSEADCQKCCEQLMAVADTVQVDLQEQSAGGTQIYQLLLSEAIEVIMRRSNSRKAYFAFCEGLLEEESTLSEVQRTATIARESLFADDLDLFPEFPARVQPTDAVIVAGAGATSTLHRDPMEWTGTSLCLEGTKVWRFLEPPRGSEGQSGRERVLTVDEALRSYRLASIAWQSDDDGAGSVALSAGWQSHFSLFSTLDHAAIPSAQGMAEMDTDAKIQLLHKLNSLDTLGPDIPTNTAAAIHTVIQKPGDLVIIPAHWWHQTFAFEPSVAIASQRCGTKDVKLVFDHISNQVSGHGQNIDKQSSSNLPDFTSASPRDAISRFFDDLMR
jgi:Cupin-like domain